MMTLDETLRKQGADEMHAQSINCSFKLFLKF